MVIAGDRCFEADNIVLAAGMRPNKEALEAIYKIAGDIPVLPIGDCVAARQMCNAIGEGMEAAYSIL